MSLHYLGKHEPGNCVFSVRHRHVFTHILLENVSGSEQNRSVIANVQSDDLWPSRMHAATHILQEKTHALLMLVARGKCLRVWSTRSKPVLQSKYLCTS